MQYLTLNLAMTIHDAGLLFLIFLLVLTFFIDIPLQFCLHLESGTRVPFSLNLIIVFIVGLNSFFIFLINTMTIIF
jgi:hypothetical protein